MIYIKLTGGLGNQMFQYAFAKNVSILTKTDFKLDILSLPKILKPTKREYSLSIFNVQASFATKKEVDRFILDKYVSLLLLRTGFRGKLPVKTRYIFEENSDLSRILSKNNQLYLDGTWQSEKYFFENKNEILRDFTFKTNPNKANQKIIGTILQSNSISIHIRRGDYTTDAQTNKIHGICDVDYYKKAISIIGSRINNPYFIFFSDDINWVKKNLIIKHQSFYVDWNSGPHSYEDLRLMSLCKHNIIANSTFSWWGAYLNKNINKTVIAPKNWFRNENSNQLNPTLKRWIKI